MGTRVGITLEGNSAITGCTDNSSRRGYWGAGNLVVTGCSEDLLIGHV